MEVRVRRKHEAKAKTTSAQRERERSQPAADQQVAQETTQCITFIMVLISFLEEPLHQVFT